MRLIPFLAALLALPLAVPTHAQANPAIAADPPQDKAAPATLESFQLPSHGALLNALFYEAAGPAPHPTVILLHGFPGNEKNLDLAQAIRRDGWNVLFFNYRGSWGSPGTFSFQHSIEDAQAAVAFLRDPANARRLRANPAHIVLAGHSMGGMIAAYTAAHDPKILGLAIFSPADMAGHAQLPPNCPEEARRQMLAGTAAGLAKEGLAPLAGCTPEALAAELIAHPEWTLAADAPGLANMPTLIITSDDGGAAPAEALAQALANAGNQESKYVHIPTDHSFNDKRIALEEAILSGLDYLNH